MWRRGGIFWIVDHLDHFDVNAQYLFATIPSVYALEKCNIFHEFFNRFRISGPLQKTCYVSVTMLNTFTWQMCGDGKAVGKRLCNINKSLKQY